MQAWSPAGQPCAQSPKIYRSQVGSRKVKSVFQAFVLVLLCCFHTGPKVFKASVEVGCALNPTHGKCKCAGIISVRFKLNFFL